jgi:hypothetical protein
VTSLRSQPSQLATAANKVIRQLKACPHAAPSGAFAVA